MRKTIILGLLLLLKWSLCLSQERNNNFFLSGNVDIDTGKVTFELVVDSSYYTDAMRYLEAKIVNGKFHIEGFMEQPLAYEISINDRAFLTEEFVVDTGRQTININVHMNRSIPKIDNAIMDIDYTRYLKSSEKAALKRKLLDSKWDSLSTVYSNKIPNHIQEQLDKELKDSYRDNDSALLEYVKENPYSYYALWKLIRLTQFGYEDIFNPIYDQFSDSLKNSIIGKKVKLHLEQFNLTSLSMKLQKFSALDLLKNTTSTLDFKTHTYTLLEFWYSNCAPCIAQFPEMSSIYKDYHSDGFEIIGISTDKISKKEIWQEVIKKHDLKWPQLLDDNGVESSKLGINVFPSNLLVNHHGQIVHVNMRPSELRLFLSNVIP